MHNTKLVAVTGATSGIGEAVVKRFARQHIPVLFTGRRAHRIAELEAELRQEGGAVDGIAGDARQEDHVDRLFTAASERHGRIPDTFVLCAGHGLPGTILGSDATRWRSLLEVNYLAVLYQLRACAQRFVSQASEEGYRTVKDIVVIGSTIGRNVSAYNPVYGSTKFAQHSLVEALRQEVCSKHIRVSLIEPGFVRSEFQRTAGYDMEWFDTMENDIGPFLQPDDIARSVDFIVHQPMHVHVDDLRIRPTRQKI